MQVKLLLDYRIGRLPVRYLIIAGFLAYLITVAAYYLPLLQPRAGAEQFFPDDFWLSRFIAVQFAQFPATQSEATSAVTLMWGIAGVDRSKVSMLVDPTYVGDLMLDSTPLNFTTALQEHLVHVCAALAAADCVRDVPGYDHGGCPIEGFKAWLESQGLPFPATPVADALASLRDYLLLDEHSSRRRYWGLTGVNTSELELRYATTTVNSRIVRDGYQAQAELQGEQAKFDALMSGSEINGRVADGEALPAAVQACLKWVVVSTQSVYVSSALSGCVIGCALACAVLIAVSRNLILTALATFTIAAVLVSVLTTMVAIGWDLGTVESVCITILAGFAVDYVVHLSYAYMESESAHRAVRVYDTIQHMSRSVIAGFLTSFVAAMPLLFTNLLFLYRFGAFMMMTVGFAVVWSSLFCLACLATFGPQPVKIKGKEGGSYTRLYCTAPRYSTRWKFYYRALRKCYLTGCNPNKGVVPAPDRFSVWEAGEPDGDADDNETEGAKMEEARFGAPASLPAAPARARLSCFDAFPQAAPAEINKLSASRSWSWVEAQLWDGADKERQQAEEAKKARVARWSRELDTVHSAEWWTHASWRGNARTLPPGKLRRSIQIRASIEAKERRRRSTSTRETRSSARLPFGRKGLSTVTVGANVAETSVTAGENVADVVVVGEPKVPEPQQVGTAGEEGSPAAESSFQWLYTEGTEGSSPEKPRGSWI